MASRADNRELILNGSVIKALFVLGWPMMITSLLQSMYNLADTFWVGRLGAEDGANSIAALQITWPVVWLMLSVAQGFGIAGLALVAQYIGAGEPGKASRAGGQVFFVFTLFSILVAIVGFLSAPLIAGLIVPDGDINEKAVLYMRVVFLTQPLMYVSIAFDFLMRGYGDTRTPMFITVTTLAINIVLDPILIYGSHIPRMSFLDPVLGFFFGNFNGLGFVGVAYASFIARSVAAIISVHLLFNGKVGLKLTFKDLLPDWAELKSISKVGFPASLGHSGTALGFTIMMFMIARLPDPVIPLAAYAIGDRIISMVFIATTGLQMAISTIVGQNLGAGNVPRAEKSAKTAMLIMGGFLAFGALALWLLRRPLFLVFTDNDAVIKEGILFIGIFGLSMPFFGLFQAISGVYSGSGHTGYSMVLGLFRLWALRVPLTFILAFWLGMDSAGAWWGMALSNMFACSLAIGFFFWGKWKTPIIKGPPGQDFPRTRRGIIG